MIKNKLLIAIFMAIFALVFVPQNVQAVDRVKVYIFYGRECPHCAALEEAMGPIEKKYPYIDVKRYEVWHSATNRAIMGKVADALNEDVTGVPFMVIGETSITGFDDTLTPPMIERNIKYYKSLDSYNDVVAKVLANIKKTSTNNDNTKNTTTEKNEINVPLIGKVNLAELSVPLTAVVIGTVDGFNPCAMWILLFLISFLMHMPSRKKMWTFGLTFLITEGLVYMGFMTLVFKFIDFMGYVSWIKMVIAAIALIGGYINLRSFIRYDEAGCEVVDEKKRKNVMKQIKKVTSEKNFLIALIGVAVLAASVNVVELACSAGLPAVFLSILSANNIKGISSLFYIFIYIIFYMLDDIIVFLIAMTTFKLTGLSNRYGKYSHLIGGIIMLIIGLLLIFKPEWLMFNF